MAVTATITVNRMLILLTTCIIAQLPLVQTRAPVRCFGEKSDRPLQVAFFPVRSDAEGEDEGEDEIRMRRGAPETCSSTHFISCVKPINVSFRLDMRGKQASRT